MSQHDTLLAAAMASKGGSGSGGTTNYNSLGNKPRINGVELSGDKSAEDIGVASVQDVETLQDSVAKDSAALVDVINTGRKNYCPITAATIKQASEFGGYIMGGLSKGQPVPIDLPPGKYVFSAHYSEGYGQATNIILYGEGEIGDQVLNRVFQNQNTNVFEFEISRAAKYITVYSNLNDIFDATDIMICPKIFYDKDPSFKPYAKSNAELTEIADHILDLLGDKDTMNDRSVELQGDTVRGNISDSQKNEALPDVIGDVTEQENMIDEAEDKAAFEDGKE